MRKLLVSLLAVVAVGAFDTATTQAQERQTWTDYISCLGSKGICVQYRKNPRGNIWYKHGGIRIFEDPYPWGFARTCPEGKDSTDNIFIFDPNSETTGIGLIGCPVCGDTEAGQFAVARDGVSTQVYTNVEDWERAMSPLQ